MKRDCHIGSITVGRGYHIGRISIKGMSHCELTVGGAVTLGAHSEKELSQWELTVGSGYHLGRIRGEGSHIGSITEGDFILG